MKYCCKGFKGLVTDILGGSPIISGEYGWEGMKDKSKWYLMCEIDMDSSGCEWIPIGYCPFCGKKVGGK